MRKGISLSWQFFIQFQISFQTVGNRAFFWGMTGLEMRGCQSSKRLFENGAFFYKNHQISSFDLWLLAISMPVKVRKSYTLKRKPYNPTFESRFETWRISAMKVTRQVLVKVVLFQVRGRGQPQNDATPNIFPDSKSLLLGLSNEVWFVSVFFEQVG